MMDELKLPTIRLYTKHLRAPMFIQYPNIIQQLDQADGYEDFLIKLMRLELKARRESTRKRMLKAAIFRISKP